MTGIHTSVWQEQPPRYDIAGQKLDTLLVLTDRSISPGLATRLHRYAEARLKEVGFDALLPCSVEVYTTDGDSAPSDRSYVVKFTTVKGGYLELCGILVRKGWPSLDHGFYAGSE